MVNSRFEYDRELTADFLRELLAKGKERAANRANKDAPAATALEVLRFDIQTGNIGAEEAKTKIAAMKDLDEAARKSVDRLLYSLEVKAVLDGLGRNDPARKAAAQAKFAAAWKEGKEPAEEDEQLFQFFFIFILDQAELDKDAALFGKALEKLRGKFGANPRAAKFFETQDARLKKLKGE